jgi:hypothetical protein
MVRNLSTVSILHYVYGGLLLFAALVCGVLFSAVGGLMESDLMQQTSDPPPPMMATIFHSVGVGLAVVLGIWGLLSGRWIANRRHRTGSMVIAALCCLSFPIGTALGVFTLVVLANSEVQEAYAQAGPSPTY